MDAVARDCGKDLTPNADQSGQAFYVGAEGFEVMVSGPPNGMKDRGAPGITYPAWKAENGGSVADCRGDSHWRDPLVDVAEANWGAEGFSGAMTGDVNNQWFEPTSVTPAELRTVEARFSVIEEDGEDQYAGRSEQRKRYDGLPLSAWRWRRSAGPR